MYTLNESQEITYKMSYYGLLPSEAIIDYTDNKMITYDVTTNYYRVCELVKRDTKPMKSTNNQIFTMKYQAYIAYDNL